MRTNLNMGQLFEGRYRWPKDNILLIIPGFFISPFRGFFQTILFRASDNEIVENKIQFNFLVQLSNLKKENFTLILGYLDSAVNNPAMFACRILVELYPAEFVKLNCLVSDPLVLKFSFSV